MPYGMSLLASLKDKRTEIREKAGVWRRKKGPVAVILAGAAALEYVSKTWSAISDILDSPRPLIEISLGFLLAFGMVWLISGKRGHLFFAERVAALLIDLLSLFVVTYALVNLARRLDNSVGPAALMAVAWLWVLYFVLLEAMFAGSPGERVFRLKLGFLRPGGYRLSATFIRIIASLVAPIVISFLTLGGLVFPLQIALFALVITVNPLSILFLEGRSLADGLAAITVDGPARRESHRATGIDWPGLVCSLVTISLVSGWSAASLWWRLEPYVESRSDFLHATMQATRPTPLDLQANLLYSYIPMGLRHPVDFLEAVGVWEEPIELTRESGDSQEYLFRRRLSPDVSSTKTAPAVCFLVSPHTTTLIRMRMLENFRRVYPSIARLYRGTAPPVVTARFVRAEGYGFFQWVEAEDVIWALTVDGPRDDYIPIGKRQRISLEFSSTSAGLLVGDLSTAQSVHLSALFFLSL